MDKLKTIICIKDYEIYDRNYLFKFYKGQEYIISDFKEGSHMYISWRKINFNDEIFLKHFKIKDNCYKLECNRTDCLDNEANMCLSMYTNCTCDSSCINFRKQLFVNKNVIYRNKNGGY